MRVGATIFNQNYTDWDRYEAEERGEKVAASPPKRDREIFNEELGIARIAENLGYVVLFIGNCASFIVSTYAFALVYPYLWQGIPDSALRHSYAILPVFWASIAIMPGTERIVAAVAALRPTGWRVPAVQGDG